MNIDINTSEHRLIRKLLKSELKTTKSTEKMEKIYNLQNKLKSMVSSSNVTHCDEYREGINMHCAECGESKHLHRH